MASSKAAKAERYHNLLATHSGSAVRLAATKTKGRHVKAVVALSSGSQVVLEHATAIVLLKHAMDEYCIHCVKKLPGPEEGDAGVSGSGLFSHVSKKGIVCKGCIKQTYYCSEECQEADAERHSLECGVVRDLPGIAAMHATDYALMRLVLAVLVTRAREADARTDAEASRAPTPSGFVFDLLSHRKTCDPKWLACVQACAQDLEQHLPDALKIPVDDIVSLACRINANSHAIVDPTGHTNAEVGVGMFPLVAMLNHSCAPNCSFVSGTHGAMIVRTLRDVEAGEELCVSYVDLCTSRDERRGKLLETKHFWCLCSRCEPTSVSRSRIDAQLDAILCQLCRDGESFYNPHDGYTCTRDPSHTTTQEEVTALTHAAERSHAAAYDLYKARHAESALTAFARFAAAHEGIKLHRGHALLMNAHATMMNAALRLRRFPEAVRSGLRVVEAMRPHVPQNWPELSDFEYRMGEVWEILGTAVREGIIAPVELEGLMDLDGGYLESRQPSRLAEMILRSYCLASFERCWKMRNVAYGIGHACVVEVGKQVERLRREFLSDPHSTL
ncbi:hypothetical protein BC830DRAFT_1114068 [Chytriomyces sp. MP71]|nr:hypothetical protein BC830DRAFT_1114068 [Chytriomyces sp. MP71]